MYTTRVRLEKKRQNTKVVFHTAHNPLALPLCDENAEFYVGGCLSVFFRAHIRSIDPEQSPK